MTYMPDVFDISEKIIMDQIHTYCDFRKYLLLVENTNVRTRLFNQFIGKFALFRLPFMLPEEEAYVKQRIPGDEKNIYWPRNRVKLDILTYYEEKSICENVYHIVLQTNQINRAQIEKYSHVRRLTITNGLYFNMRMICAMFPNLEYFSTEDYEDFNEMLRICRTLKKIKLAKYSTKNDTCVTRRDVKYRFVITDLYDMQHLKRLYSGFTENIFVTLVTRPNANEFNCSNYFTIDKMIIHGKYDAFVTEPILIQQQFVNLRKISFAIDTNGKPVCININRFERLEQIIVVEASNAECICVVRNVPFILFCAHTQNVMINREIDTTNVYKDIIIR